jgi:hypothetical protein
MVFKLKYHRYMSPYEEDFETLQDAVRAAYWMMDGDFGSPHEIHGDGKIIDRDELSRLMAEYDAKI